ncbi:hypothetical protein WA158_000921 [Blastocystis sp. Blastoise]
MSFFQRYFSKELNQLVSKIDKNEGITLKECKVALDSIKKRNDIADACYVLGKYERNSGRIDDSLLLTLSKHYSTLKMSNSNKIVHYSLNKHFNMTVRDLVTPTLLDLKNLGSDHVNSFVSTIIKLQISFPVASYSTLISFPKNNITFRAIENLIRYTLSCPIINPHTYCHLITGCKYIEDKSLYEDVIKKMQELQVSEDSFIISARILYLVSQGREEEILKLYTDNQICTNDIALNNICSIYINKSSFDEAKRYYYLMKKNRIRIFSQTACNLLALAKKNDDFDLATDVYQAYRELGLKYLYPYKLMMLFAASKNKGNKYIWDIYKDLERDHFKMSSPVNSVCLRALTSSTEDLHVNEIMDIITKDGYLQNPSSLAIYMRLCLTNKEYEKAIHMYTSSKQHKCPINEYVLNQALKICLKGGKGVEMVPILEDVDYYKVNKSMGLSITMLGCYRYIQNWTKGEELIHIITTSKYDKKYEQQILLNILYFYLKKEDYNKAFIYARTLLNKGYKNPHAINVIMMAFVNIHKIDDGFKLLKALEGQSFSYNKYIYTTLLNGCRQDHNFNMAKKLYERIEQNHVTWDYVMARVYSDILCDSHNFEDNIVFIGQYANNYKYYPGIGYNMLSSYYHLKNSPKVKEYIEMMYTNKVFCQNDTDNDILKEILKMPEIPKEQVTFLMNNHGKKSLKTVGDENTKEYEQNIEEGLAINEENDTNNLEDTENN